MRPRRPAGTWVPHWRKSKLKYLLIPIPPNGFPLIVYGQCRMALPVSACQKSPKNTLLFRTSRIQQCGNSLQVSGRFWRSAKPTLCKGGWHGAAVTGGLYVFKRIPFLPQFVNPSVKNQRFLPAPFTQGSRGAPAPVRFSIVLSSSRIKTRPVCIANRAVPYLFYFPGLKESFRLTERLNTRCSGLESLLSGQK